MELTEAYRAHVERGVAAIQPILVEEGYDRLVLYSGDLVPKNRFDDQDWPFSALPMFRWMAPLNWPQSVLLVPARGEPTLYAVQADSIWERLPDPDWELLRSGLDVQKVDSLTDVKAMGWHGRSAFVGQEPNPSLVSPTATVNPSALLKRLEELRTRKTPYEVELLARASRRAVQGHRAARDAFFSGESDELMIHLQYLRATGQDDAQTPYKNIVALGRNGATLHHIDYIRVDGAPTMLIDAGATQHGYGSDITRTYLRSSDSEAVSRFQQLIEGVTQVQQACLDRIQVGLDYEALHDFAHHRLAEVLSQVGLVRCSAEAAEADGITRSFFPHGLGHSLGAQVHDVGCLHRAPKPRNPFLRNTRTIEVGQVFTVEPGLYFIDGLLSALQASPHGSSVDWAMVEALRPFGGIRIEDDVHVTPDGIRNLTREAFQA